MTNRDWIVRRASLADLDALEGCARTAAAYDAARRPEAAAVPGVDYRAQITVNPVWIAEYNNEVIGILVLHLDKKSVSVVHVLVSPRYREKGLGRMLMSFTEEEARKRNCKEVTVTLDGRHRHYLSLYEHLGWARADGDVTSAAPPVLMRKALVPRESPVV